MGRQGQARVATRWRPPLTATSSPARRGVNVTITSRCDVSQRAWTLPATVAAATAASVAAAARSAMTSSPVAAPASPGRGRAGARRGCCCGWCFRSAGAAGGCPWPGVRIGEFHEREGPVPARGDQEVLPPRRGDEPLQPLVVVVVVEELVLQVLRRLGRAQIGR